jgi:hypothetical protein
MVGAGESHYLLVCIFFISFDRFWVRYFLGRPLAIEGNESLSAEVCGVGAPEVRRQILKYGDNWDINEPPTWLSDTDRQRWEELNALVEPIERSL